MAVIHKIMGIVLESALRNIAWMKSVQYKNTYIQL